MFVTASRAWRCLPPNLFLAPSPEQCGTRLRVLSIITMSNNTRVERKLISSGSAFEREIGYSRAVVDGDWIFVSGTTGFDYRTMVIPDGLVEQTEQCLCNIQAALAQAGASLSDAVRVVYVLPKASEFPDCWPVLRKYFGDVRPAAMMISAGLADPRMRIEIEVTARRRGDPEPSSK